MIDMTPNEKSYFIWTVGCQMNVADSNYVAAALRKRGYGESADLDSANVVVLNSCVVRQAAEDRIVGKLGEVAQLKKRNPAVFVALTGCMVTEDQDRRVPDERCRQQLCRRSLTKTRLRLPCGPGLRQRGGA